ncbi:MAG TPA: hypothetical protein DEB06_11475, partial [Phycisphaerales bacterium]|nr:hypothetical protein [Phycisphaerales bacterium]
MPPLNRRLDLLRRLPRAQREAALLATIPVCGAGERDALVAEVLALGEGGGASGRRGSEGLIVSLARWWGVLSEPARGALVAALGERAPGVLDRLHASDDAADRAAAANLAIACLTLGGGSSAGIGNGLSIPVPPAVDAALARAAERFDEQRLHAVMDAIARTAHAHGPAVGRWLGDAEQPGHLALRAAARSLPSALARRRATSWLALPALRGVAREILLSPSSVDEQALALEQAHLLLARGRASALRAMGEGAGRVLAHEAGLTGVPLSARRGQVRWAGLLPLDGRERLDALASALSDPSPLVRFDAATALSALPADPEGDALLADFAFDADEPVALAAITTLADAGSPSRREAAAGAMRRLARSPHARVRRRAVEALAAWDPLDDRTLSDRFAGAAAARSAMARAPLEFLIALRREYASADAARRVRLLEVARRVGAVDRLEEELIAGVTGDDERVASKAALLLGRLGSSERARRAVVQAAGSAIARVRANAVEAFLRLGADEASVGGWARDDTPRVRASAVRHLLIGGPREHAVGLLAEMLGDPRPDHRVSALWAAERTRTLEVVNRVADLTRHDDDPRVQTRARRCARALLASMRRGWSGSGATIGASIAPVWPANGTGTESAGLSPWVWAALAVAFALLVGGVVSYLAWRDRRLHTPERRAFRALAWRLGLGRR